MSEQRSKTLTCLLVFMGICNFIMFFSLFDPDMKSVYRAPWGELMYYLNFVFVFLEVLLIVNLWKMKAWARSWFVVLMVVYIGVALLTSFTTNPLEVRKMQIKSFGSKNIKILTKDRVKSLSKFSPEKKRKVIKDLRYIERNFVLVSMYVFIGFSLVWYLFLIFYFTRKKTKERFS